MALIRAWGRGIRLERGRADAGDWLARLIAAALQERGGAAPDGALATIRSFAGVKTRDRDLTVE